MTEIFIIRHTQAEGNLYRMMQGHWDGDVTDMGLKQIEALAARFKNIHIDAVYSSDLRRARMTASAVTRHTSLPLRCDLRLREIDLGPWERQFFANLAHDEPQAVDKFINHPEDWYVEGAESFEQVRARVYPALRELACAHEGQSIAVVSHGVTIRCLISAITGLPLSLCPIHGNTGVSRVIYENGFFTVDYTNDQSHLEGLGVPQWHKSPGLRHEAIDPAAYSDFYVSCYEQAWLSGHSSLEGFRSSTYLESAKCHHARDKDAVLRFLEGDEAAGLLDMDTCRGQEQGIGWISLLYLRPEYRGRGCAAQLLARAMVKYAEMGRKSLRLTVAESNESARSFYRRMGFKCVGSEYGVFGGLLLMEKDLGEKCHAV